MHSHRRVLPVVRSRLKRHASTAAKLKPAPELDIQWTAPPPLPNDKWSSKRPKVSQNSFAANSRTPAQGSGSQSFASSSSTTPLRANHSKWALPTTPYSGPSPQPARTSPQSTPQNSQSRTPRFTLPPTVNHNKWSLNPQSPRTAASSPTNPRPASQSTQSNRPSQPFQIPKFEFSPTRQQDASKPQLRNDSRLDRDPAPHMGLSTPAIPQPQADAIQRVDRRNSDDRQQREETFSPPEQVEEPFVGDDGVVGPSRQATPHHLLQRDHYKKRGSIASQIRGQHDGFDVVQVEQQQAPVKPKRKKALQDKKVRVEVYIPSVVSVGTLARLLNVKLGTLQRKMRQAGMSEETSYDHMLTSDYAALLVEEFGKHPVINDEAAFDIFPPPPHPDPASLPSRPPVITIMGHVDHGKTTLLDNLRSTSVAKGEAGGITQHIGAFSVPVPSSSSSGSRTITFLDTPGHAAFSAMRARGAGVTDIVVLVVAADDGVMPQTKEVINLVKQDESKVGLVVAINKVDKPGVDVTNVQHTLMAEGIQLEALGGDVPSVEVSGLTGHGLPELVETLSVMAEMQNLNAERDGAVHGYILESKVMRGLGPVATVLVLRGSLKPGAHLIAGLSHGKVRLMTDSSGSPIKVALPGTAVIVSGWKTLPGAGDEVLQAEEADIKKALDNRERKAELEHTLVDAEAINQSRRKEREIREEEDTKVPSQSSAEEKAGPKELRLIVKGDVSGSVEAVVGALQGIGNHIATTKIISSGVGDIAESDIMMAKAANGMIVGFSVKAPRPIETLAAQNHVPIYSSPVIYRLMEEIKSRVIALLPPVFEKRVSGEATILQLFDIHLKGKVTKKVAGCRVTNGIVEKNKKARLVRNGVVIHEGSLDTMRVLKKDVTEIRKGSECGLSLAEFEDIKEGDIIQMYTDVESPGSL